MGEKRTRFTKDYGLLALVVYISYPYNWSIFSLVLRGVLALICIAISSMAGVKKLK